MLRPLRTISGIEGLRIIVVLLLDSIPLLRDVVAILLFSSSFFSIAGV
ncbi:MAG: ion transporter [Streptococcus sp.]|nr:ion transporter [Streptococcus sp.]